MGIEPYDHDRRFYHHECYCPPECQGCGGTECGSYDDGCPSCGHIPGCSRWGQRTYIAPAPAPKPVPLPLPPMAGLYPPPPSAYYAPGGPWYTPASYTPAPQQIRAIETSYAGCRFRSRLEARWAVFFDTLGIKWQYEPERFAVGSSSYLPDFLLETGTWIEVKGDEQRLDKDYLIAAARQLPLMDRIEWPGPKLLVLGDIPEPRVDVGHVGACCGKTVEQNRRSAAELEGGDWGWIGLERRNPEGYQDFGRFGFGMGWPRPSNRLIIPGGISGNQFCRPAHLSPYTRGRAFHMGSRWTEPTWHPGEFNCAYGYAAARSARFEHGQEGPYR